MLLCERAHAWGFFTHRLINEKAVFALPSEMFAFYKSNIDYLREHAVDPDKRRYAVKSEGQKHYLDMEFYTREGLFERPYESSTWDSVKTWFDEDDLDENGTLPWNLEFMLFRLTKAFQENDVQDILKISAEIGHYMADANVPLHTSENYDGQLTNQRGIHSLWETRIPERFSDSLDASEISAEYLKNPNKVFWKTILNSNAHVNFVLKSEADLRNEFDTDKIYRPSTIGKKTSPKHTSAFVQSYGDAGNLELVKNAFRNSIKLVASLWYTAWVNAGQPNLNDLVSDQKKTPPSQRKEELEDHIR